MKTITVSDETYERIKDDLFEEEDWIPKIDEKYWCFEAICVTNYHWTNSKYDKERVRMGNCFKTREEAEKYFGRIRSMKPKYLPEYGDYYYTTSIDNGDVRTVPYRWRNDDVDQYSYLSGQTFKTKEECREWIDEFSKYFEM